MPGLFTAATQVLHRGNVKGTVSAHVDGCLQVWDAPESDLTGGHMNGYPEGISDPYDGTGTTG